MGRGRPSAGGCLRRAVWVVGVARAADVSAADRTVGATREAQAARELAASNLPGAGQIRRSVRADAVSARSLFAGARGAAKWRGRAGVVKSNRDGSFQISSRACVEAARGARAARLSLSRRGAARHLGSRV